MASRPNDESRREFGHLYRRERSRYWWARYRVGDRTYEESTKTQSRQQAEKFLLRRQVEMGIPGAFVDPRTKRFTFEQLMQLVRDHYRTNGCRSADRLEDAIQQLERVFGGTRARAITADRLARYAAERLEQGAARQTIKNELQPLHQAFAIAKRAKQVAEVPEFPTIGAWPVRSGFFEPEDLWAVLEELPGPIRPLIEFLHLTGWRLGEARGLTWDRVDFAAGVVRLDPGTTKNAEGRTFPFGALPPLQALLARQRKVVTRQGRRLGMVIRHVFPSATGEELGDFHKTWNSAVERAAHAGEGDLRRVVRPGLVGRIVHDLRRTAVRNLVRAGVSEHTAMKLTGHLTRSIFDRYDIVDERDHAAGVAKLAALHREASR